MGKYQLSKAANQILKSYTDKLPPLPLFYKGGDLDGKPILIRNVIKGSEALEKNYQLPEGEQTFKANQLYALNSTTHQQTIPAYKYFKRELSKIKNMSVGEIELVAKKYWAELEKANELIGIFLKTQKNPSLGKKTQSQ